MKIVNVYCEVQTEYLYIQVALGLQRRSVPEGTVAKKICVK
jgi:hypothetical protein